LPSISKPRDAADGSFQNLTADRQPDLRQLAGGEDGGGDELGALGCTERLGRRVGAAVRGELGRGGPYGTRLGHSRRSRSATRLRGAVTRRAEPIRARAGERAEHAVPVRSGLRLRFWSLLRHARNESTRGHCVNGDYDCLRPNTPAIRAALRMPEMRPVTTAGGSRQMQRLDSAASAAPGGCSIPVAVVGHTYPEGRLSLESLARTGLPCQLWICRNSKKSRD